VEDGTALGVTEDNPLESDVLELLEAVGVSTRKISPAFRRRE
jgi:hypothetical protein